MKKNNIRQARSENLLRSIDDLIKLNDGEKFMQGFIEIYPLVLLIKKENVRKRNGSFLDFFVKIKNN